MDKWVFDLPVDYATKVELQQALDRRSSTEWSNKRAEWYKLCSDRLEEKKDRAIRKLIYDEKIFATHFIDDRLKELVLEYRNLGYSVSAVSEASRKSISNGWLVSNSETPACRIRGQVIELLEDIDDFDLKKWLLKGSYNTQHGKALTDSEKEKILWLFKKGYSIAEIAKTINRSPSAVRRQVEKNELGHRKQFEDN